MKTSTQGIRLIKEYEGCKLKTHRTPVGVLTIGYGHSHHAKPDMVISFDKADELLLEDISYIEQWFEQNLPPILQNQFDALVSLVANIGLYRFGRSKILKLIKANPENYRIGREFGKWLFAKGEPYQKLRKRREAESKLYFSHQKENK